MFEPISKLAIGTAQFGMDYGIANHKGQVYEDEFKDWIKHGRGKFTFAVADGRFYEGDFKDDKISGQGKKTFANGDVYEGTFKEGREHGQGKLTIANGDVYKGKFKDGMLHGQGKYILAFFGLTFRVKFNAGVAMHGTVHFGD